MKRLTFQSLSIMSQKEKAARTVTFDPQMTVFKGTNDTGKSSLLKSIYCALGAKPHKISDKWKGASVIMHLDFELDGVAYSILRVGDAFSIFNRAGQLLLRCESVTNELGPYIAQLCQFSLPLMSRGESVQATPAFLFLPFCFDQDGSWTQQWNGFNNLSQFSSWKKDVVNFHTGIKPTEYYTAKAKREISKREETELLAHRKVITDTLEKVTKKLERVTFDIDVDSYQAEVDILLKRCNELSSVEEDYSSKLGELESRRIQLLNEEKIVKLALSEIADDGSLASKEGDEVECPTCGNVYGNTFAERFSIAQDAARCRELLVEILSDLSDVGRRIELIRDDFKKARSESEEIKEILNKKQGEIKLHDIIRSEGNKEVRHVLRREEDELAQKIGEAASSVEEAQETMDAFSNKDHRVRIVGFYRKQMRYFLSKLDVVTLSEKRWKAIDCSIQESGSDLPRALLAYYYAILNTVNEYSTSTFCPIIIDSPRQQDLDEVNWKQMLEVIRDEKPKGSQLIISLVDDDGVNLGGKEIVLDKKWALLREEQYEQVESRLRPYLEAHLTIR